MLYLKKYKRIFITIFLFSLSFFIIFVKYNNNNVEIAPLIQEILIEEKLSNCHLTKIADYKTIEVYIESPRFSQKEFEDYIHENHDETKELTDDEYNELRQVFLNHKKIQSIMSARNNIMDKLIDESEFNLSENDILDYSRNIIQSYEVEAYIYNCSLREYIENVLNITYEDFFENCYVEGENMAKKYLIIGAIYQKEFYDEEIEGDDIFFKYQEMENKVFSLFIHTDSEF